MSPISSRLPKYSTGALLRLAGSLGSAGLLLWLLHREGWGRVLQSFGRIPGWCIAACVGLMIVSRLATWLRWHILLRGLGVEMTAAQSCRITFAGLFSANFLPSTIGGDVARLAGGMQLGYSGSKCAASLFLDRVTGLVGMLVAVPFGIPALHAASVHSSAALGHQIGGVAAGGSLLGRIRDGIARVLTAIREARPISLIGALLCTWVHMLCLFSIVWLVLRMSGQPLGFGPIAGLWAIIYLVSLAPISINGLGLQELSVTGVLHQVGISTDAALAVALIVRVLMMLCSLPGALFLPAILSKRKATDKSK